MRRQKFDLAFKSRMHVREHLLLAISGARRRIAFEFGIGDRTLTDPIKVVNTNRHKADDWLALLEPFGGPSGVETPTLQVSPAENKWADDFLTKSGAGSGASIVGLHPGASIVGKRWPLERFVEVGRRLLSQGHTVVAFVEPGGYGEKLNAVPGLITARVSLRQMIALIARCRLLVCNDSGPMHIAALLGVPVVAVFGSGISGLFAPLGTGHRLVATTRHASASSAGGRESDPYDVAEVAVTQVMEAIDATLASTR